jgi:hypothetical protein
MKVGFIQRRLMKSESKKFIQYFPDKNWIKDIELANKNNFRLMEWTANLENIKKIPYTKFIKYKDQITFHEK